MQVAVLRSQGTPRNENISYDMVRLRKRVSEPLTASGRARLVKLSVRRTYDNWELAGGLTPARVTAGSEAVSVCQLDSHRLERRLNSSRPQMFLACWSP